MTRDQVDMTLGLFGAIVQQLDPFLTELIVLHSDGEPLLNPDIFKMIRKAKKLGFRVMTSTNATLLRQERVDELIDSGLDILTISLDGISAEVYEKIRRGGKFSLVMSNIHDFLMAKGERPPFTIIQMIVMKENEHQANDFMKMWRKYKNKNVYPVIKPMTNWFGEHSEVIENWNLCDRVWFGMVVQSNGNLVPCVHDIDGQEILGKLPQDNIYDLWNGDKMVTLRRRLLRGRDANNLCKKCNATSPRKFGLPSTIGLSLLDMATIAKILPVLGYKRPKQY